MWPTATETCNTVYMVYGVYKIGFGPGTPIDCFFAISFLKQAWHWVKRANNLWWVRLVRNYLVFSSRIFAISFLKQAWHWVMRANNLWWARLVRNYMLFSSRTFAISFLKRACWFGTIYKKVRLLTLGYVCKQSVVGTLSTQPLDF